MPKIAIVEDVPTLADMYKFKFEQSGFQVVVGYNGQEGFDKISAFQPEIVLLDLMMPVMSGDIVLEKIRGTDWGKKIKVIILTNIGEDEAPVRLQALNVSRYMVKADYTPAQVVELVQQVLLEP